MQLVHSENVAARKGIVLCLLSMLVFATQDGITKVLVQDMAVAQFVMVRYWIFALFAVVYLHLRGTLRQAFRTEHLGLQLSRSILSVAEIAIFNLSLRYLGLAEAHALLACFPLLAIVLAGPLLGERVGRLRGMAVLVGFIGTLIIIRPGLGLFKPEALIALSAAVTFALYNIITRKVSRHDNFDTNMLYMALVGCIGGSLFGIPQWQPPNSDQWLMLSILSVSGIAGHLFLVKALEYAPASMLQPFNYSLLLFATLIGVVVFAELPDGWTILGAAIVIGSGLYAIAIGRAENKRC
ncbi:DMT family transporter [Marinobacterium jannaschii]|uniref:DMT family transporter n=1 Tax=Marinobacterium jannaschii TaxID=64970 RepID=UPI000486E296|nr:DMT family transporter [Marinobacterium jannaschii]